MNIINSCKVQITGPGINRSSKNSYSLGLDVLMEDATDKMPFNLGTGNQ
jgi:hypothetical protein